MKKAAELMPKADGELPNNLQNLHEPQTVKVNQRREKPGLPGGKMEIQGDRTGAFQSNVTPTERVKTRLQHLRETEKKAADGESQVRELTEKLAVQDRELVKMRAEICEAALEQGKSKDKEKQLQKQLAVMSERAIVAEQENAIFQEEFFKSSAQIVHTKDAQMERVSQLKKVERRNVKIQLKEAAHQTDVAKKGEEIKMLKAKLAAATQEIARFKTSLRASEVENRKLKIQIVSAKAKSSSLSADVATYKCHWEESRLVAIARSQANAKLTKRITALQELAVREKAKSEQSTSFEEFIETDLQCAICFEVVIASTVLNCGHTFCSECVHEWRTRSSDCPTCREPINSMRKCKMLDSFIAGAANRLSRAFRDRRREATDSRGTDLQGQPQRKKPSVEWL